MLPQRVQAPATIDAQVTVVEPLGAEFLLSFALNGNDIMSKIASRALPKVVDSSRFALGKAPNRVTQVT